MKRETKETLWDIGLSLVVAAAMMVGILYFCPSAKADLVSFEPSKMLRPLERHAVFVEKELGLPDNLLAKICQSESNWNPDARGKHGEIGVCQILPTTAAAYLNDGKLSSGPDYFKPGDRGDDILRVQTYLKATGRYVGKLDGIYGPKTFAAVKMFQEVFRLKVDGIVGVNTWEEMFGKGTFPKVDLEAMLLNPQKNIEIAGLYLKWIMLNVSDDPVVMAIAYNGGQDSWPIRYIRRLSENGYTFENRYKSMELF